MFPNLLGNLQSKFGRNKKAIIYRSVKVFGIGPSLVLAAL